MASCFECHESEMSWIPSVNSVNVFDYIALKLIGDNRLVKFWAG